jgi:hypothetical protein
MNIQALLDFGFKEFPKNPHDTFDRNWQYCLRDEKGKKIFIQVRLWAFSKYSSSERTVDDSFDAKCQFDMRGPKTFNVTTNVNDMTPRQVVDWFDGIHTKMGCVYYELYDDDLYDEEGSKIAYNCLNCGIFLGVFQEKNTDELCEKCRYEKETGFKQPLIKSKKRR